MADIHRMVWCQTGHKDGVHAHALHTHMHTIYTEDTAEVINRPTSRGMDSRLGVVASRVLVMRLMEAS